MRTRRTEKQIIGRKDRVDFPKMRLYDIDAKIDTGAYTSAIHCHNIKVKEKDGQKYVTFNLLDPTHPDYNEKRFRLALHAKRRIKSSFGKSNDANPPDNKDTIEINRTTWIRGRNSGLYRAFVDYGNKVKRNQIIASITDPFGETEYKIKSPVSGYIIGLRSMPVVNRGDAIINIGVEG